MAKKPEPKKDEPQVEKDLVPDQQTGGTHDTVTKADVHVEPTRAAALDPESVPAPIVGGHDATQDRVDYAAKAELVVPAPVEELGLDDLALFVRKHEDAAALLGKEKGEQVVVVEITHPTASETAGIYQGRDGGIRMSRGKAGAVYSDGSKHGQP